MNRVSRAIINILVTVGLFLGFTAKKSHAQTNTNFNFSLGADYSAAEQTLDFFDRVTGNADHVAKLRGNQLASATSVMLARTEKSSDDFRDQLELARNIARFESDVYGFFPAKNHIPELRKLLTEAKRRQLDRRIVSTLASFFPVEAKISTRFSVYFVVIGNERAAAFVRRVVWNYDTPTFVNDNEGEPVIVVNLARIVERPGNEHDQFIELLSTTAHECFHAVLSELQKSFPDSARPGSVADHLLELVQNEGVAYYLSQETHVGGEMLSGKWYSATSKAVEKLNSVLGEMVSSNLTRARAQELIMDANLSGSFEGNYGATAGLRMAYEIDRILGRPALTATLLQGGRSFILTYQRACLRDGTMPQIDKRILHLLDQSSR
jgi:hypothetical protein